MAFGAPVILVLSLAACGSRGPGYVTPGIPAPNCDGYDHPEENPACPEWVSPWMKPTSPIPATQTPE